MSTPNDLATLGDIASIILVAEASDVRAVEYRDAYVEMHETASQLLAVHNTNICDLRRMERMHQQRCEQLAKARLELHRLRKLCLRHGISSDDVPTVKGQQPKRMKLNVD